jgi:hypothetical protein
MAFLALRWFSTCEAQSQQGAGQRRRKPAIHLISATWLGQATISGGAESPEIRAIVPCQETSIAVLHWQKSGLSG